MPAPAVPDVPVVPVANEPAAPAPTPVVAAPPALDPEVAALRQQLHETQNLNQQYAVALGNRMQQPQQHADPNAVLLERFDEPTKQMVRAIASEIALSQAQQVKHQTIAEMRLQDAIAADAELLPEARVQYAQLVNNPLWANVPEAVRNEMAITQARLNLEQKRSKLRQAAATQQVTHDASRAAAGAASLPSGSGAPPVAGGDKETFVKNFMADGNNLSMFRKFERGVDPNSIEGQKKFREYAEGAWIPTTFGGSLGTAMRNLSDTTIEVVR